MNQQQLGEKILDLRVKIAELQGRYHAYDEMGNQTESLKIQFRIAELSGELKAYIEMEVGEPIDQIKLAGQITKFDNWQEFKKVAIPGWQKPTFKIPSQNAPIVKLAIPLTSIATEGNVISKNGAADQPSRVQTELPIEQPESTLTPTQKRRSSLPWDKRIMLEAYDLRTQVRGYSVQKGKGRKLRLLALESCALYARKRVVVICGDGTRRPVLAYLQSQIRDMSKSEAIDHYGVSDSTIKRFLAPEYPELSFGFAVSLVKADGLEIVIEDFPKT